MTERFDASRAETTTDPTPECQVGLADILNCLPLACLTVADDGRIQLTNDTAQEILEKLPRHNGELKVQTLFPGISYGENESRGNRPRSRSPEQLIAVPAADGGECEFFLGQTPLPEDLPGSLWLLRDASAISDPERALLQKNNELNKARQDFEQFVYGATHDLKEPLRVIDGHLNLLQLELNDILSERTREYLYYALDGVRRAQALIDGLLNYSRTGFKQAKHTLVDADRCLEDALTNLAVLIEETDAEISRDPLPSVLANATQLTMLFQNFVSNAIKFTRDRKPQIHIGYEETTGSPHFYVRDNGIGIAAAQQERIFRLFERLHTSEEYEGTGIGLALCKRIVELHDGRIWVESVPDEGAVFHFTLGKSAEPRSTRDKAATANIKTATFQRGAPGLRALTTVLVDDVPGIRELVRYALEKEGQFKIIGQASTGQQGIDLARELQPDALLLDLSMPGMDGLEALPQIVSASPHSKVVIYSGFEDGRLGETARKLGAVGYIEKGATPDELRSRLLALVNGAV